MGDFGGGFSSLMGDFLNDGGLLVIDCNYRNIFSWILESKIYEARGFLMNTKNIGSYTTENRELYGGTSQFKKRDNSYEEE